MQYLKPRRSILKEISAKDDQDISLDVYRSDNFFLREFFWLRLWFVVRLIRSSNSGKKSCLDFCGGSGVLLPSLATRFEEVFFVDQHTNEAVQLVERMGLRNVTIHRSDIRSFDFGEQAFDAVVAADVLEHFLELDEPISKIHRWLRDDGTLFTSLPTENFWYRALRLVFGKEKPHDHYHTAAKVENYLKKMGFKKIAGMYHPLGIPCFPLFRISAWKKSRI